MFSNPMRSKVLKEDGYTLPLLVPVQLDAKIKAENGKVVTALRHQIAFDALRQRVLEELPKNKQMFKTVPSYASLDSITPPWGFVSTSEGILLSPYAQLSSNVDAGFTGDVTFTLVAVLISRSSVIPHFQIDPVKNVIELAWVEESDLAEVSDIPSVEGGSELRLVDPAAREKAKQDEKERIRELFREAQELAEAWYEKYEPSDTESTFSEWMGEEET